MSSSDSASNSLDDDESNEDDRDFIVKDDESEDVSIDIPSPPKMKKKSKNTDRKIRCDNCDKKHLKSNGKRCKGCQLFVCRNCGNDTFKWKTIGCRNDSSSADYHARYCEGCWQDMSGRRRYCRKRNCRCENVRPHRSKHRRKKKHLRNSRHAKSVTLPAASAVATVVKDSAPPPIDFKDYVFRYGSHRDKHLSEVMKTHLGYVFWVAGQTKETAGFEPTSGAYEFMQRNCPEAKLICEDALRKRAEDEGKRIFSFPDTIQLTSQQNAVIHETMNTNNGGGGGGGGAENPTCAVCWDAPVEVVSVPCGHYSLCEKCSRSLKKCPICRENVTKFMKIFHC